MPDDSGKPRLFVESAAPDRTVAALRDILVGAGGLFDRGVPVRLARDQIQHGVVAQILTPDVLVLLVHRVCRPYALKEKKDGSIVEVDVRLPRAFAVMYLDWRGEWRLPPLNGIASAPLLQEDGTILSAEGYDPASGMWRERVPDLRHLVAEHPSRSDAETSLRLIRHTFRTFCFADACLVTEDGIAVVDIGRPPGKDESAFLVALLTAVCRPSLHHAPGILFRAAPLSGAGAGKGLLARCIAMIAFGREPHAVTGGIKAEELEKRITAELIEGSPVLFLDNLNNTAFRSDLLASAITERPARVRVLGRSQMVPLNPSALIVLTGNGLTVSEDLARRFITIELDPKTEDPEARRFSNDIRLEVTRDRTRLLAAALTIWRWGRLGQDLPSGRPLGSFETWCQWVRDPLLALDCMDPVARIAEAKAQDGRRLNTAELFTTWWERHQDRPIALRDLDDSVRQLIDPHGRGRQFVAAQLGKLVGTRLAGLVLTRAAAAGKWGSATFAMEKAPGHDNGRNQDDPQPGGPKALHHLYSSATGEKDDRGGANDAGIMSNSENAGSPERHRGHRGHRAQEWSAPDENPWSPCSSDVGGVGAIPPYADAVRDDHGGHRGGIGSVEAAPATVGQSQDCANPADAACPEGPMPPMPPMPSGTRDETDDEPFEGWSMRL
ncbi:hypothetical protein [Bauldia litoralis]|uniref:hypothetical protein n=1 Tax=Bauldia litoralis TaxID=665467 RepID=UPI0011141E65|nr:hypothetical protein [Bauldia litoralis]